MKILMAYEHYPCSIARFWKRALQRLGHEVHSTGHSTGGSISWGPMDLRRWADTPEFPLANFSNTYQIDSLTQSIISQYDLFINVDAAHSWIGKAPVPKIIIGTDPHCLNYDRQRQDCDMFVCMQRYYSRGVDVWIPYAYDPEWHFRDRAIPRDHDVTFYGVFYDERKKDLEALSAAGINVESGTGVVFSEGSPRYSAAPLAYCRPSLKDLPARFFEAMAYGCIPLITSVPDLLDLAGEFTPGYHYEIFSPAPHSTDDIVTVARRVLDHPRLEKRRDSCEQAVKRSTWDERAKTLLAEASKRGLIKE